MSFYNVYILNEVVFTKINLWAGRYQWLDYLGVFLAAYSQYLLLIILILWFVKYYKKYGKNLFIYSLIAAIISRFVITQAIKTLFYNPRPFEKITDTVQLIPESGSSFPSGHASFFFALSTVVWFYNRKLGYMFYGTSLLMGLARIFVGVHWPLDVVAGALLGVLVSLAIIRTFIQKASQGYEK